MWPCCSECFVVLVLILVTRITGSNGINCYKCSSNNGSEPACEDPIDTSIVTFTEKCTVPKKGHIGLFPANFCIKIVGRNSATYETMVVRACALKSMDNQCGEYIYQEVKMTGCILTCDYNACNIGVTRKYFLHLIMTLLILVFSIH